MTKTWVPNWLKHISCPVSFLQAHFKGKRYSVPEESNKLFVPLSRQAQQGYTTSCLKGDKRDRYAVNTRVWAQVGNGDWWPGKIIADDSTPMQTSSTSDGHRGNKRPVVVQLYNFEGKRHAVFTLERRSVEAFLPNSRPHVSEALKRAVEAALNDADATPLINEPNAVDGDDQDSAEDTSSQGVSSEATESSDPKSEVAAQPEPKPRGRYVSSVRSIAALVNVPFCRCCKLQGLVLCV